MVVSAPLASKADTPQTIGGLGDQGHQGRVGEQDLQLFLVTGLGGLQKRAPGGALSRRDIIPQVVHRLERVGLLAPGSTQQACPAGRRGSRVDHRSATLQMFLAVNAKDLRVLAAVLAAHLRRRSLGLKKAGPRSAPVTRTVAARLG